MRKHKQAGSARPGQGRGPSQRQLRVGEAVRHALSAVLDRGGFHDPDLADVSITVTEVEMSPDLRLATVHVVPLGGVDGELIVAALNRAAPAVRHQLAPAMTLKFHPAIRFSLDTSFDRVDRIEALLDQARRTRLATEPTDDDGT